MLGIHDRDIENASLKTIIHSGVFCRSSEESDEIFFAKLAHRWEEAIKLSKREKRLYKELEKKIWEFNTANSELTQEIFWVTDYLCEGLISKKLVVKWNSENELTLGNEISIRKDSNHLILSWTHVKFPIALQLKQCRKLMSILTDLSNSDELNSLPEKLNLK